MMKNRIYLVPLAIGLWAAPIAAQTTTNLDPSAALEVASTTQGFLPPRMTEAQRNAIPNPAQGLLVYNSSTQKLSFFSGSEWNDLDLDSSGLEAVSILSPSGQTWLTKNLGAARIATSSTDTEAYGDLYQWGRTTDGHEKRNSNTASGPVASGNENDTFISTGSSPYDWLSSPDASRWNGTTKGPQDPCPDGFRVPTETEWNRETALFSSQNTAGAFASVLKLPAGGYRNYSSTLLSSVGTNGYFWTSETNGTNGRRLTYGTSSAPSMANNPRANAMSIRCIQE